jgi:Lon-like ATP-dependent protease
MGIVNFNDGSKKKRKIGIMTESDEASSKNGQGGGAESVASAEMKTTEEVEVPKLLIDQVIGQEHGVEVIKKAATQRRHVMLIGTPGTGKSMLASSMAELLPKEELQDILVYPNTEDKNTPKIRIVPRGKGKEIVDAQKQEVRKRIQMRSTFLMFTFFLIIGVGLIYAIQTGKFEYIFWAIIAAAVMLLVFRWMMPKEEAMMPKLLVTNAGRETAPFVDATGAHSGALLGDVRHDPYQSGGLETPAHDRVEAGTIHKAHKGVLFIDEINTLRVEAQQNLLTALQEKEYPITGQSERSAGAMVKTEPVPCDFIMVAAGNLDAVAGMHPALRSRIKGYGYEIYMKDTMDDTEENRKKLVRFIAQEVRKDKKIPHFDRHGVEEIIREARRRAGRKGHFTLILRDLGGLVRVAGDIARAEGVKYTTSEHVIKAKAMAKSVEQQVADEYLEHKKDYKLFKTEGFEIGKVNGLAVVGDSGVMLPIIAEVTPAQSREEGKVIATGRLQEIAQEAVQNVSAVFKKFTGKDISTKDIHIQFVGTHEGVEGDSASISVATAVISSLEDIPVDQSVAMTGSLSVRGDVLPVGGITPKVEAAAQAGIKEVLIPQANLNDVLIEDRYKDKVKIIPVVTIEDVLEHVLVGKLKKKFIEKIKAFTTGVEKIIPEGVVDKRVIQQ